MPTSKTFVNKGEPIDQTNSFPLLLLGVLPWPSSMAKGNNSSTNCYYCHVCGTDLSLSNPKSLLCKLLNVSEKRTTQVGNQLQPKYGCSHCDCDDQEVLYCSPGCQILAERYALTFHQLTCRGSRLEGFRKFGRYIQTHIQSSRRAGDFHQQFLWHCILATSLVILSDIQNNDQKLKQREASSSASNEEDNRQDDDLSKKLQHFVRIAASLETRQIKPQSA